METQTVEDGLIPEPEIGLRKPVLTLDKRGNLLVDGVRASDALIDGLAKQTSSTPVDGVGNESTRTESSAQVRTIRTVDNTADGSDLGFMLFAGAGVVSGIASARITFLRDEVVKSFASIADAEVGVRTSVGSSLGSALVTFVMIAGLWAAVVFGLRSWHRRATNRLPLQISVVLFGVLELGLAAGMTKGIDVFHAVVIALGAGALFVLVPKALR